MVYKTIGIVSYLPDDENIRKIRFGKLCKLIETCNQLFNLPIHIIIQNYKDELLHLSGYKNVTLSENYTRCGIVGARKKLREWFLNTPYDCLIMLDDDCEIIGTREAAKKYLDMIDSHKDSYGEFKGSQLKLFTIYKSLLKQVDFKDINPEDGDGFEDTVFVETLRHRFPKQGFSFCEIKDLKETSLGVGDMASTWYNSQNILEMLKKTDVEVKKI